MKPDVKRARRLLTGTGVIREDSDDELGLVDHPWEWIKSSKKEHGAKTIIGAQMGNFKCMLGECMLLKAESSQEAWVGLICGFRDNEEDEKAANIMWFSSEKEIRNKQKKRKDVLPNELYITPSWDINPLTSINGKATIVSKDVFHSKYPSGKVPRTSTDYGKIFVCRRGCNTRTAMYTDEFVWEDVYHGMEVDIENLIELVEQTKLDRKKKKKHHIPQNQEDEDFNADVVGEAITPNKKRLQSNSSPTKPSTPQSKRVITKRPLEFTPLGTRVLSPSHINASPFQMARTKLHVSAVPVTLPCREEAFSTVYDHLEAAISNGSGSCIYISGTPGTGKTATVKEVVTQLHAAVMAEELDDFIFVEINGLKVTDPHQSYSLLWEAIRGDRVSPSQALDLLEREFSNPSPRRVPCVVLMDELDQLVTKNQSVMYNFFNWPGLSHSRLIVLAVANTMDLPERTLSNKISSRLGLTRITFPGYTHNQLMTIIESRLEGVPGLVDPDAVQFASRKVAAVSGDARRALDICRRAVEIAEAESKNEHIGSETPSRRPQDKEAATGGRNRRIGRITIRVIKQAIDEATSTPTQQLLRTLPLPSKLFLAALMARIRRSGVTECSLSEIIEEAKRLSQTADYPDIREHLLRDRCALDEPERVGRRGLKQAFPRTHSLGDATVELMEAGLIHVDLRGGERTGKIYLKINQEEIILALKDDSDVGGLGLGR